MRTEGHVGLGRTFPLKRKISECQERPKPLAPLADGEGLVKNFYSRGRRERVIG